MYDIISLNSKKVAELKEIAKELNISKYEKLLKQDLIYKILDTQALAPVRNPSQEKPSMEEREERRGRGRRKRIRPAEEKKPEHVPVASSSVEKLREKAPERPEEENLFSGTRRRDEPRKEEPRQERQERRPEEGRGDRPPRAPEVR
ncbi:MAG TPA: Rho termination factor N-terminal domain-containing protein, partial [Bacteroidales bacterium]|nr:Rho termination factor N-terminal domain-containing protein [Bacteroidales bacterium]